MHLGAMIDFLLYAFIGVSFALLAFRVLPSRKKSEFDEWYKKYGLVMKICTIIVLFAAARSLWKLLA
jgi:hypothetical protein